MKFRVTMKGPDVLHDAIREAVDLIDLPGLDAGERELVREQRAEKARELCNRWFEWGEYLVVEIDTEAETCVVVPTREGA